MGPPPPQQRIAVAYIARTKGVRGHVKAEPLTHDLSRFAALDRVTVDHDGRPGQLLSLESWRREPPGVLLKFAGIDTPEAANARLVKGYVTVEASQVPELPAHTYYVFELVGCVVVDEVAGEIGKVTDVLTMPTTDVYQVKGKRGEIMIPAVRDYIVAVDRTGRCIHVRGVDELIEA